jgi:hypothetical protein
MSAWPHAHPSLFVSASSLSRRLPLETLSPPSPTTPPPDRHLRSSSLRVSDWKLVFSTTTHGYRLAGLYDEVRAAGYVPVVVVVRDTDGYVRLTH